MKTARLATKLKGRDEICWGFGLTLDYGSNNPASSSSLRTIETLAVRFLQAGGLKLDYCADSLGKPGARADELSIP